MGTSSNKGGIKCDNKQEIQPPMQAATKGRAEPTETEATEAYLDGNEQGGRGSVYPAAAAM